jgi:RimJ/RimL family protein N-acetyltransferase
MEPGISHPRIETARLVLEPVTTEIARAVIAGDLSSLSVAEDWPHEDTVDAMSIVVENDAGSVWLILLDGRVIGDCGTSGAPSPSGEVVIGYGLGASSRGRGFATEAMRAVCAWLFAQPEVTRIVAVGVLAGNIASRRVLEKLGFVVARESDQDVSYALVNQDATSA